jgi:peptidoglycan/LPS O-acetylase OafA/YrhL
MTVECFATPLIYLAFIIGQRQKPRSLIPIIAVLFGLSFVGQYVHLLGGFTNLAPLYSFVLGVWLHFTGRKIVEGFGRSSNFVAAAACAALCFAALQKSTAPIIAIQAISSGLLVALIAFDPMARSFRVLDNAVVMFYGRISYSFYLLHTIGLLLAARLSMFEQPSVGSGIWTTIATIIVTTPMAWVSWRLIEKPFRAIGRTIGELALASPRGRRELTSKMPASSP